MILMWKPAIWAEVRRIRQNLGAIPISPVSANIFRMAPPAN